MRKVSKQREYAAVVRAQHSVLRKQQERKGVAHAPVKANHVIAAEKKREAVSMAMGQVFLCITL